MIKEGQTVRFNATASGINKSNFVYQWRKGKNESLPGKVSGANGTVLTIPDLVITDEGDYYCTVTNEWGRSLESSNVTLIIEGTCEVQSV